MRCRDASLYYPLLPGTPDHSASATAGPGADPANRDGALAREGKKRRQFALTGGTRTARSRRGGPSLAPRATESPALFSLIQAAGWPIWFLIIASIAAIALIVERSISLRRDKVIPRGVLEEVLTVCRNGQVTGEMAQRLAISSPLGRVLATGLRYRGGSRELMKDAMEETGRAVSVDLERYLSALGTIASTAPLLGLFGTVIGMIEIFGAQGPTSADPHQLAHGISVALYNTAFGILVAIPAMIAYRHFRARVDSYLVEMEQQSLRLVEVLMGERR